MTGVIYFGGYMRGRSSRFPATAIWQSRAYAAVVLLIGLCGCHSVGPNTIGRDHFDYNEAISASWKEQMLLNMVRLRYGESPMFLDVVSVIAQYSLEGQISANAPSYDDPSTLFPRASAATRWIDRPTITYAPRAGQNFAATLLTPLRLESLFALIQAGWPLELTLSTTVRSINGVLAHNRVGGVGWNPAFVRAVDVLSRASESGVGTARRDGERTIYEIRAEGASAADLALIAEMRTLLDLDPEVSEYEIVAARMRGSRRELAFSTASVIDVLSVLSAQFDVPAEHVALGWTFATMTSTDPAVGIDGRVPIVVHSGSRPPEHVFVSTFERGAWFWIDEGDYRSKRAFSFLVTLLNVAEIGASAGPVVTIGAGG
jgi:hypothetical protein